VHIAICDFVLLDVFVQVRFSLELQWPSCLHSAHNTSLYCSQHGDKRPVSQ